MREIDRLTTERYATPSLLLMEAAANAAARAIAARFSHDLFGLQALILCGRGNNGGDGAALARILWMVGALVEIVLFGRIEDTRGDARTNFEIVRHLADAESGAGTHPPRLSFKECPTESEWEDVFRVSGIGHNVIVDALFGTGLTRPLEGMYQRVIERFSLNRQTPKPADAARPLIVSLDIPSGLDADAAGPIGETVRADLTITFTAPKPANVLSPAAHYNGELIIADIGSPSVLLDESSSSLYLIEKSDAQSWLAQTRYTFDSYKNTHGHALIIAGSRQMSGAAVLCGNSAMRAGAGLVTIATPASALPAVAARVMPEVMTAELPETEQAPQTVAQSGASVMDEDAIERALQLAGRADALAIGPGLTSGEIVRRFVRAVVERRTTPVIIDADGLNALAPWPADLRGTPELPIILTPHLGEMRRLIGAIEDQYALADHVQAARDFAVAHQLILVLKGARTLIAAPDGRVAINPTGNAGVGTAGAGDTLTGIITGFIAQAYGALKDQADAFHATVAAVYTAGLASDLAAQSQGMRAMVASDISQQLGAAICALAPATEYP